MIAILLLQGRSAALCGFENRFNGSFIWLPALCYALAIVPVLFYLRYERLEPQIRLDLEQRRALAAMSSGT